MPVNHATPKPLQVAAAVIGNALEWYDFIIFGVLTVVISRLFFPAESQYASLLLTTATFGVGFFMRPVGGILLGIYADQKGRKAALLLIIVLMTAAIAMIGFAPTYAAIGVAAPLIILLARLLQGFATGGEVASATSFLIESAPAHRRGFYGSWQMVGQGLAVLVGVLLGALLTRSLAPETLDSWGWRVPFLLGLVIGPVGLFIRRHLQETEAFLEARGVATVRQSFGTTIATHLKQVLVCMGIITSGTISFYVILLYMPTFARTQLHLPLDQAFAAQSISLVCMIVLTRILGPGGFDPARDITAITVNRWPHGYAYEYNPLFDPDWPEGTQPHVIGRASFGRITIANSDSGAAAYTDSAIDQAFRAVQELFRT